MSVRRDSASGLTYAEAGVDIDAGNALVEAIKPLVRSDAPPRRRCRARRLRRAVRPQGRRLHATRCWSPPPTASAPSCKIAIDTGQHDTIGIDLVAMCVNDLVVQGAEPLFFLDYFATGKLDGGGRAEIVAGIAEGCRHAGCALIGGETAEMPGMYAERRLRPRRLLGRRGRTRPAAAARRCRGRRRAARPAVLGRAFQRLFAGAPHRRGPPAVTGDRRRPSRRGRAARPRAAGADAHLCEDAAGGASATGCDQGAGAHHRRRLHRATCRACCPRALGVRHRPRRRRRAAGVRLAGRGRRGR